MPRQHDVTLFTEATGQIAAINAAPLMARVQGYLQAIRYRDGAFVPKGTDLFTIEPDSYLAQVHQAEANLASAKAKATFADLQAERYAKLAQLDSTSRQQAEQTRSDRDSTRAALRQAEAALEAARITYGYTKVIAPFDGLVSAHQANVGALVGGSGPTQLATIVQLDPIWVNFNVPEQQASALKAPMLATGTNGRPSPIIQAGLQNETGYPHSGVLDYVAPTVDEQTGTLQLRGLFHNADHRLLPGSFVHVRIQTGISRNALLVPDYALGEAQGQRTLMVVDATNHDRQRLVVLGPEQNGWTIITSGLRPNERVIVGGLQVAKPNQLVRPHLVSTTEGAGAGQ